MALPAYAQATIAEFKRFAMFTGTDRDDAIEEAIARASLDVEEEGLGGRRVVYRGPIEDDNNIVASADLTNTPVLTVAGQPNSAGRTLIVTKTDTLRVLTAGTLTVTGTVGGTVGVTEVFDLMAGNELHGIKFFTAVSAAALTDVAPASGTKTIKVGTSEGYTEFYSPNECAEVTPIEWPLQNVHEVAEDINRVFGSTTVLTVTTQYEVRNPSTVRRRIVRVSNFTEFPFYSGYRVVRARMSAGYRTSASVPQKIKGVCLELAAWHFSHSESKQFGLSSVSDGMGSRSFSGPPVVTAGMKDRLATYLRSEFCLTGERDFALEATA